MNTNGTITDMKPAFLRNLLAPVLAATLAATLAACGSDGAAPVDDTREAGGEVLEGSITDDMIPLDQLQSQGESAEPEGEDGEEGGSASTSGETEAAPAEEPAEAAGDEPAAE